jgi:organic radical activating enzyme
MNVRETLDSVGKGFCPQKWRWLGLSLHTGQSHSCYHPPFLTVPLDEIKLDPSALHNNSSAKQDRKKMLEGGRPDGCTFCWNIEDIGGKSDRILRNYPSKNSMLDYISETEVLRNTPWDSNVNPYMVEVSFSNSCNFKCGYCCPSVSSLWEDEVNQHGNYDLQYDQYGINGKIYSEKEYNPYVEAFWKWWPDLKNDLRIFRITGGEPLMTTNTFKLLDMLREDGNPELSLQINTNLGVSNRKVKDFCGRVQELVEINHIKNFRLFTSLECTDKQAEYIRRGLNYELFLENVNTVLETVPTAYLSFMSTYNVLTVPYFKDFLQLIVELRKKWGNRILMDIPHLKEPPHWTMNILPKSWGVHIDNDVEFMLLDGGFRDVEIAKMKRVRDYFYNDTHNITEEYRLNARKDFAKFFPEYDRRSNSNLADTFPEFTEFLEWCKEL